MEAGTAFVTMMRAQLGALFGWVPVCLAVGIGGYFSLKFEPSVIELSYVSLAALTFALIARTSPEHWRPLAFGVMLVCCGVLLAALRAHLVAGPVLEFRYYGLVEGRSVAIDRPQSNALRLTLDEVVLNRVRLIARRTACVSHCTVIGATI